MVKDLYLLFALLAIASKFTVSSDTDVSYQIGELNNKLTYMQRKLDLFDYITEGNVSVLMHRVEVRDLKCAENVVLQMNESNGKLNNLQNKMDALASDAVKMDLIKNKFSFLMRTVYIVVDKINTLASHVSQLQGLESKSNALAATVSNLVHKIDDIASAVSNQSRTQSMLEIRDLKWAENVVLQMNESNGKLNNLENKMDDLASDAAKMDELGKKFSLLTVIVPHVVDEINKLASQVSQLQGLESKSNALAAKVSNLVNKIDDIASAVSKQSRKLNRLECCDYYH